MTKITQSFAGLAAICFAFMMLTGCPPPEEEPRVDPSITPSPNDMDVHLDIIDVELADFEVNLRDTLPAGSYTLRVTNTGQAPHNIEIEGPTGPFMFDTNLSPGETRDIQVNLEPGIYHVYCPVGDHEERGMVMSLTVTADDQF